MNEDHGNIVVARNLSSLFSVTIRVIYCTLLVVVIHKSCILFRSFLTTVFCSALGRKMAIALSRCHGAAGCGHQALGVTPLPSTPRLSTAHKSRTWLLAGFYIETALKCVFGLNNLFEKDNERFTTVSTLSQKPSRKDELRKKAVMGKSRCKLQTVVTGRILIECLFSVAPKYK